MQMVFRACVLFFGALSVLCCGLGAPASISPQSMRNVVWIIVDDLGWRDIGVAGSVFYETPNIDRLAAAGMLFTQFNTASPVCSPTRASFMTGKHPARVNIQTGLVASKPVCCCRVITRISSPWTK